MTRLEGLVPGLYTRNGDFNIRGLATFMANAARSLWLMAIRTKEISTI